MTKIMPKVCKNPFSTLLEKSTVHAQDGHSIGDSFVHVQSGRYLRMDRQTNGYGMHTHHQLAATVRS